MVVRFEIDNYNVDAQKFYNFWIKDRYEVLGIIRRKGVNDSRKEDYLFFRDGDNKIRCVTMPRKEADSSSCFFGDVRHFCETIIERVWCKIPHEKATYSHNKCFKATRREQLERIVVGMLQQQNIDNTTII